jgi:hypothetical protein
MYASDLHAGLTKHLLIKLYCHRCHCISVKVIDCRLPVTKDPKSVICIPEVRGYNPQTVYLDQVLHFGRTESHKTEDWSKLLVIS